MRSEGLVGEEWKASLVVEGPGARRDWEAEERGRLEMSEAE